MDETIDVGVVEIVAYPAAFVRTLSDEIDRLNAVIAYMRKLHRKLSEEGTPDYCSECRFWYPCDTIKALDGAQSE